MNTLLVVLALIGVALSTPFLSDGAQFMDRGGNVLPGGTALAAGAVSAVAAAYLARRYLVGRWPLAILAGVAFSVTVPIVMVWGRAATGLRQGTYVAEEAVPRCRTVEIVRGTDDGSLYSAACTTPENGASLVLVRSSGLWFAGDGARGVLLQPRWGAGFDWVDLRTRRKISYVRAESESAARAAILREMEADLRRLRWMCWFDHARSTLLLDFQANRARLAEQGGSSWSAATELDRTIVWEGPFQLEAPDRLGLEVRVHLRAAGGQASVLRFSWERPWPRAPKLAEGPPATAWLDGAASGGGEEGECAAVPPYVRTLSPP